MGWVTGLPDEYCIRRRRWEPRPAAAAEPGSGAADACVMSLVWAESAARASSRSPLAARAVKAELKRRG